MRRQSLRSKMVIKTSRSKREVFLRSDFEKLGGYDQVGRALQQLTSNGFLIKLGYGLYAKARVNRITGKPMLSAPGGFAQVSEEALTRLGVKWVPSESVQAYQNGGAQIPANAEVVIFDRFSRKIKTDRFELKVSCA
jgi:hypothetical protein